MLVSGVITQGARHTPDWVTEYRVSYSLDGQRWDYYKENGTAKVILFYTLYLWYIPMLSMLSTIIYWPNITYGVQSFLQNKSVVEGSGFDCSFNTISTFFTNTFCTLNTSLRFNHWTVELNDPLFLIRLLNCNQLITIQIFAKFYKNPLFSSDDLKFALNFEWKVLLYICCRFSADSILHLPIISSTGWLLDSFELIPNPGTD